MNNRTGPRIIYVGDDPLRVLNWLQENADPADYEIKYNKQKKIESISIKLGLVPPEVLKRKKHENI